MPAYFRCGQALGLLGQGQLNATSVTLNAAGTWYAVSFVPDLGRTLSTVRVRASASGTLGSSDITCDLYDSAGTAGAPGSAIETGKLPTATISGGQAWRDFTGFSTALTAGQQYYLVF